MWIIALAALAYPIRRHPPLISKLLAILPPLPALAILPHLPLPHLSLPTHLLALPGLPHRKPRLSRTNEVSLVAWAAEDIGLLDYGAGDEFVNAHGHEAEEVPLARGRGLFGGRDMGAYVRRVALGGIGFDLSCCERDDGWMDGLDSAGLYIGCV
ncbi:hypothetical protein HWV62_39796 [Athelia sp. TMB]|nr:hypothetical protein HWV62_39796 [Athelia sp. TMB]